MKKIKIVIALCLTCILIFALCACKKSNDSDKSENPEKPLEYGQIFYRPEKGVLADVIPYYEDGEFKLFYLHDYRDVENYGVGIDWNLVTTENFVSFEEQGVMIERGNVNQQDLCAFTGSIIKKDDTYHIFYTGNNANFIGTIKPKEAIMHAVSSDMLHWKKQPADTFYAPEDVYLRDDWRDPFVYYDEDARNYKMLIAARSKTGPENAGGVTAMYSSSDLISWKMEEPLYAPQKYHTLECPDLFKIGDWWYLVFSEFSDRICTRYVMSRDKVNWIAPEIDMFDGRGFYAAKTVGDGDKRFIFGWVPVKAGNLDSGGWEWGGNLAVHELKQRADGTLAVSIPGAVDSVFQETLQEYSVKEISAGKAQYFPVEAKTGGTFQVECEIEYTEVPEKFGVSIRHSEGANTNYRYVMDAVSHTFRFENYPAANNFTDVTVPFDYYKNQKLTLTIIVENDVCTAYLNGEIALSTRMNDANGEASVALFAEGGSVTFRNVKIKGTGV